MGWSTNRQTGVANTGRWEYYQFSPRSEEDGVSFLYEEFNGSRSTFLEFYLSFEYLWAQPNVTCSCKSSK